MNHEMVRELGQLISDYSIEQCITCKTEHVDSELEKDARVCQPCTTLIQRSMCLVCKTQRAIAHGRCENPDCGGNDQQQKCKRLWESVKVTDTEFDVWSKQWPCKIKHQTSERLQCMATELSSFNRFFTFDQLITIFLHFISEERLKRMDPTVLQNMRSTCRVYITGCGGFSNFAFGVHLICNDIQQLYGMLSFEQLELELKGGPIYRSTRISLVPRYRGFIPGSISATAIDELD
jgi:hypothetical protein